MLSLLQDIFEVAFDSSMKVVEEIWKICLVVGTARYDFNIDQQRINDKWCRGQQLAVKPTIPVHILPTAPPLTILSRGVPNFAPARWISRVQMARACQLRAWSFSLYQSLDSKNFKDMAVSKTLHFSHCFDWPFWIQQLRSKLDLRRSLMDRSHHKFVVDSIKSPMPQRTHTIQVLHLICQNRIKKRKLHLYIFLDVATNKNH